MSQPPPTSTFPAPLPLDRPRLEEPTIQALPVTPGKVAVWLFLATEVMFFTGLIGSYIVLRAGSPAGAYSSLYSPNTDLALLRDDKGVVITDGGPKPGEVAKIVGELTGLEEKEAEAVAEEAPQVVKAGLSATEADALASRLKAAGATVEVRGPGPRRWPAPYDKLTNPLSIDLTALNTFFLICSSVTMVFSLSAIQRGQKGKCARWLWATVAIGSLFLGIQVLEYSKLMFLDLHSVGVSANRHFLPSSSLFASCFFTMTGFHGAHVFAGVVLLTCIATQATRGKYSVSHHSPVELVGLYWHFVDLVWILLFTVVYLV